MSGRDDLIVDGEEEGIPADGAPIKGPTRRRLLRYGWSPVIGGGLLVLIAVCSIFANAIAPFGSTERVAGLFSPPSAQHLFGTDDAGHDMLSLLIYGMRTSLLIGVIAALVSALIGGTLGTLAGYLGGRTDSVITAVTDFFIVIPTVPLMIVLAAVWGRGLDRIILVIGLLYWTTTARLVRAQVKAVRERVFVQRARSLGARHVTIVFRHIIPHTASLVVASSVLLIANAIFAEAALSFLGLGDSSSVSLGTLIQNAYGRGAVSRGAWWAIALPGIAIGVVVLSCSLVGRAIEDGLNPRLRTSYLSRKTFKVEAGDQAG